MLIYSDQTGSRLFYVLDLIFQEILGLSYVVTEDFEYYKNHNGHKFVYAVFEPNTKEVFIQANGFLKQVQFDKNLTVEIDYWDELPIIFPSESKQSVFPFDVFAAAFYLVTRYEEYQTEDYDKHGRFQAENSIAFKYNFLQKPIVNYYVTALYRVLKTKFPSIRAKFTKFKYLPTIDVDVAFEMRANSLKLHLLKTAKMLVFFRWKLLIEYWSVIFKLQNDPNDTFEFLQKLDDKYHFNTLYFILFAKKIGYDINNNTNNKHFKKLLIRLSNFSTLGIHPSYASFLKSSKIKEEKERLSTLIQKNITKSRNHFLRNRIPETLQNLIEAGIEEDYTMGYASQPGFRASICNSFLFFDLYNNQTTTLRIYPFMCMDGTYFNYLKLNPDTSFGSIKKLVDETALFGGQFISLWHNNTLAVDSKFLPWRELYIDSMEYIDKKIKEQNG